MAKHAFEYDDETRQITGPGYLVNEVWKLVADKREAEVTRQARWHDTYNAALPGAQQAIGETTDDSEFWVSRSHALATDFADRAHGPLEKL